jgi:thymidylate synthase
MEIIANGINDAWLQVIKALQEGKESSPRGKKIKEIKNMSVEIKDPKKRILSLPIRNISLPFAFGELCWYLSGRNDVEMMGYYSAMMKNFSDDGKTLNSAYGYRIFGHHPMLPFNQWNHVVNQLRDDPDTRQAVIHLHTPNNKKTKDEVCTLGLQFMIREGKLDMVVNMRSNDIIWGFTYDVFSFTSFQELMANELGIEVGTYYHNAASMHIYDKDFSYFDYLPIYDELMYMTSMDVQFDYDGITIQDEEWENLFSNESFYRLSAGLVAITYPIKNKSLSIMDEILCFYHIYKLQGKKSVTRFFDYENIYHGLMRNYVSKTTLKESSLYIIDGCDGSGKSTIVKQFSQSSPYDVIHFDKPSKDFNKLIYFQIALSTGNIVLDRFYYSEWIYASVFKRDKILDWPDVDAIEKFINFRNASYLFVNTPAKICYERLDENDRKSLTLNQVEQIQDGYEILFRVSKIKDKERKYVK